MRSTARPSGARRPRRRSRRWPRSISRRRRSRSRARRARRSSRPRKADAELWALRRQYLARQLAALRARVAMLQGKQLTFDEESLRALRRGGAGQDRSGVRGGAQAARGEAAGRGHADRALRSLQAGVRHPDGARRSRVPGGDPRLPRAHVPCVDLPTEESFTRRVRHRQIVERLQLVSGQLQEPDPGQHRPADLHRSRDRPRVPRGLSRAITSTTCCSRKTWSRIAAGSSSRSTRCSRRSR